MGSAGKQTQWGHVMKGVEYQKEEFRYVDSEEQRERLVKRKRRAEP